MALKSAVAKAKAPRYTLGLAFMALQRMDTNTKACRNCACEQVMTCDSGALAPFFLKRVLGVELYSIGERLEERAKLTNSPLAKLIYRACLASRKAPLASRLLGYTSLAKADVRVCAACGFVSPEAVYTTEALGGLYIDYRSETYNRDRCRFEPEYEKIQHLVGKSSPEVRLRQDNVNELLTAYVDIDRISTVLDWGGGEGRFVPRALTAKAVDVLDISDETLFNPEHRRIAHPEANAKYDFIQVCHVLEHVAEPLELLRRIVGHLGKDGLLYVEVPQDRSDDELDRFRTSPASVRHSIHEHLNLYSVGAVKAVGGALGLNEIAVRKRVLDLGWTKSVIVSGLFSNTPNS